MSHSDEAIELAYRKVPHESPQEYIRQNTALVVLHGWGRKINAVSRRTHRISFVVRSNVSGHRTGQVRNVVDFFPMSRPTSSALMDITPPKPVSYQLRLTIWNTSDVELNDENMITGEKTSDINVKAWILGEKDDAQQNRYSLSVSLSLSLCVSFSVFLSRSLTGEGNFNWRFLFNFNYLEIEEKIVHEKKDSVFQVGNMTKKLSPRIVIRVYDADLLLTDDFLGECVLNMTHLPIGEKSAKKWKAEILLILKHRALNLFVHKRLAGKHSRHSVYSKNERSRIGWWPMIAPLKSGEIRDESLLAVSERFAKDPWID